VNIEWCVAGDCVCVWGEGGAAVSCPGGLPPPKIRGGRGGGQKVGQPDPGGSSCCCVVLVLVSSGCSSCIWMVRVDSPSWPPNLHPHILPFKDLGIWRWTCSSYGFSRAVSLVSQLPFTTPENEQDHTHQPVFSRKNLMHNIKMNYKTLFWFCCLEFSII